MSDGSKIEWTDATWSVITGCSVVSPGCTNCYAMRLAGTRLQHHPSRAGLTRETKAGPVWTGEVRLNEEWLDQPLRWKKPRRIFVAAHGDLFHESVPDEWIDRVFAVMALAPQHTFQVLTKRPERMRAYMTTCRSRLGAQPLGAYEHIYAVMTQLGRDGVTEPHPYRSVFPDGMPWPLPNVWLGTSAEDQRRADERIPHLLATPAAVRFVSAEPLLTALDLECWLSDPGECEGCDADGFGGRSLRWCPKGACPHDNLPRLDWVIVGGESGPGARPMHPEWARSLRDQCAAAGVAFFMKQMAHKAPIPDDLLVRGWPATAEGDER